MSENWYVVHTQPRGEKMLKALLDREPAVADTYLPMRQQFAIVGGQRVSRMALTMPGLVFVRGNKNQLVALLREKSGASRLMVDSSRKEKDAMVVADSEMTAFRLFNDNTAGQLMMLRSPFCNFTSADRIRIMSGPFAGYEGYIREIGGDNKLIFKVGSMAIALSNVMRYDVAVVENHHASTETSLQLRIADSLRARLGRGRTRRRRLRPSARHNDRCCRDARGVYRRRPCRSPFAGTILRLRPQTHRQHRGQRSAAPLPYAHRRDRHTASFHLR